MLTTIKWQVLKAATPMTFSPKTDALSTPYTTAPCYMNFKLSRVNLELRGGNAEWILPYL